MLLLIFGLHFDTHSVVLPNQARMTQMERNQLSIRHVVLDADFREFRNTRTKH
jgi:long-subunit fatty acid transport protein